MPDGSTFVLARGYKEIRDSSNEKAVFANFVAYEEVSSRLLAFREAGGEPPQRQALAGSHPDR
ncbi:MAG: hypothetical protein ACI4XL_05425 [Bacillus sp. (in: firmicutes)]